ncbi:serine protease [Gillisia sp. Hel_I_29]|uniref:S1 family peptidase n=1 Tax=Gillisia sp. Hel_I_29 TaxID=1249975 RepID=UPI0006903AA3|nr:serine protease [Gillisia sp. Hel_I_29]
MKNRILLLLFSFLVISCKKEPPSPDELYDKYRESVVLIKSDYYHEIQVAEDISFYFTGSGDNFRLYQDKEEAFRNADVSFGTGFLIDKEGKIATNRHVIYPEYDKNSVFGELDNFYTNLKQNINLDIQANKDTLSWIKEYYNDNYDYLSNSEIEKFKETYSNIQAKNENYNDLIGLLNYEKDKVQINLVRTKLGVAYDNTFIENSDDFADCVAIRKSENENIDLAIIQLKNKRTPSHINNLLSLPNLEETNPIKLNDEVYMIGYNHGFDLAITKEGVKSQFTSGNVSQDPDSDRILYSVPTLPGSSGSPIINKWGDLIAVNYAKTYDYQGFSLGIPIRNLVKLYNDLPIENDNTPAINQDERIVSRNSSENSTKVDYSNNIKSLLTAEKDRNFDKIYSHFSKNIKRYWNINYPTKDEIHKQYLDSWETVRSSRNEDVYVEKINDYNYILNTKFYYVLDKTGEQKSVESEVRYKFNDAGQIIEVYGVDN